LSVPVPHDEPTQFRCVTAQPVAQQPGVAHSHPSSAFGAAGFAQLECPDLHFGSHVPAFEHVVDVAFVVEHARPHSPQFVFVSVGPQLDASVPASFGLPELDVPPASCPPELPPLASDPVAPSAVASSPPPASSLGPPDDESAPPLLDVLPEDEAPPLSPSDEASTSPDLPPPEPPMQTWTGVDVARGAEARQVSPVGHPWDESQKATHLAPMQMSFSPQVAEPCVSSQLAPSPPGPAPMHE
jgi:hypothetical protein